ncbi:MAG: ATP-binding protein [Planctomycetes bacterium]|nr:ATP-binding protein [Planctomycetota bacterium]
MFESNKTKQGIEMKMSATLENINVADDLLTEHLKELDISVDLFAVRILLREALLNAVMHGSDSDSAKEVSLRLEMGTDSLTLRVSDSGEGFAWGEDWKVPDNLTEGGRGLALMKIYSNHITFNQKGNEVILQKNFKVDSIFSR